MKLFLLRHGKDEGDRLTKEGREQIHDLAGRMQLIIVGSVLIYTSLLRRAVESAEIIANVLAIEDTPEKLDFLGKGDGQTPPGPLLYEALLTLHGKADFIVCVTHTWGMIDIVLHLDLQGDWSFPNFRRPEQGEALLLNFDTKTGIVI